MNSNKLVSVIVPVYNAETTLRRCVDSILKQDYQELQVILIDDGSTDESSFICDDYALIDKRACVIHQQNAGVCAARNKGLDKATGRYISYADNDDFIIQGMYSHMVSEIQNKALDICICHHLSGSTESDMTFAPKAPKL